MNLDAELDNEAVIACADLVARTGATRFEIGYLHDDVPVAEAGWYAHAQYRGTRISVEDQPSPVHAASALAGRLLDGGKCTHCGGPIALSSRGVTIRPGAVLTDGSQWPVAAAGGKRLVPCLWQRRGREWVRGCEA